VRRQLPVVSIVRNGRVRSFVLRPWLAVFGLVAFGVFSTAYIAATGYLIYRDDLLGGALARQVAMQYAYEDRIAALRAEVDRVTSRQVLATQGVGEQLAALLGRQAMIDRHRETLSALMAKAEATGVRVSMAEVVDAAPRLPRQRPSERLGAAETPSDALLAYSAPGPAADAPITGKLLRGSGAAAKPADLQPVLSSVEASLDGADAAQSAALEALSAASKREAAALSRALAPLGVVPITPVEPAPQGGPFVPATTGLHFVEQAALLGRALDDIAALRRTADALPIRTPVAGATVSSGFGTRLDPFLRRPALHAGVDFVAPSGADVRAAGAGTVVSAEWSGGYGIMVEIRHGNGVTSRYGHLAQALVRPGDVVEAGAPIGRVGSTGRSTGPHLHFETRRDGEPVDPAHYLAAGRAL